MITRAGCLHDHGFVLRDDDVQPVCAQTAVQAGRVTVAEDEDFDLIEDGDDTVTAVSEPLVVPTPSSDASPRLHTGRHIGTTEITQGNIDNNHICRRSFLEKFPADAIGGSNRASAAQREIALDCAGVAIAMTDLDAQKKFYR